jgi:hypothetical protein
MDHVAGLGPATDQIVANDVDAVVFDNTRAPRDE